MRNFARISLVLIVLLTTHSGLATLDSFDFTGPVSEARYRALIEELRCLVCQNESLVGSQADLAQDLRQEIYEMMAQGQTDEQIVEFMVARYGDFVLYNPPLKPSTYLLWFGPFVLLAVAAITLYRVVAKRRQVADTVLTAEQKERVKQLLDDS